MWLYSFKLLQEEQEPCWVVFENDCSLDDVENNASALHSSSAAVSVLVYLKKEKNSQLKRAKEWATKGYKPIYLRP